MKFQRASDFHEISECGTYTVALTRSADLFKFHAWILAPAKGKTSKLLGTFDDAVSARECCRKHREGAIA